MSILAYSGLSVPRVLALFLSVVTNESSVLDSAVLRLNWSNVCLSLSTHNKVVSHSFLPHHFITFCISKISFLNLHRAGEREKSRPHLESFRTQNLFSSSSKESLTGFISYCLVAHLRLAIDFSYAFFLSLNTTHKASRASETISSALVPSPFLNSSNCFPHFTDASHALLITPPPVPVLAPRASLVIAHNHLATGEINGIPAPIVVPSHASHWLATSKPSHSVAHLATLAPNLTNAGAFCSACCALGIIEAHFTSPPPNRVPPMASPANSPAFV